MRASAGVHVAWILYPVPVVACGWRVEGEVPKLWSQARRDLLSPSLIHLFSAPFRWTYDWRESEAGSERAHSTCGIVALPEVHRPASQVASAVRSCGTQQVQTPRESLAEPAGVVIPRGRACLTLSPPHTGHFSSFQAISQNIHSYLELMRNACSMRFFSSCPAVRAQVSILARIHSWTASNSCEAYSISQSR